VEIDENAATITGAEHHCYAFAQFMLDVDRGALLKDGTDIPLRPKCFEVLTYLVKHHGVLLSKDEILTAVWADVVVTEDSLTQCMIQIRKALDDKSKDMVRTVPRRGYLFDVQVQLHGFGEKPEVSVTPPSVLQNRRPSRWSVGAAIALALAIFATWWSGQTPEINQPLPNIIAHPNSIAVLPFEDMSPEGDQEYFADGLSEEVLNLLAQIPELQVIARTSSFSFKGQHPDIQTIAGKLNVANILEGSVRKDGDQIRITAQLVNASNGIHLWSQTYDRTLDNVFAVQSDIAGSVAGFLKVSLLDEPYVSASNGHNPAAWEAYLKGKFFYGRRGTGDNEHAIAQYQEALRIDPELAEAWVGLAGSIYLQTYLQEISWEQGWTEFKAALDKALALDPDNAEVHVRLASYYWGLGEEENYQLHFDRALELGQSNALVLSVASGISLYNGKLEDAIEYQRRAATLDPLGYVNHGNLAHILYFGGYYDEARDEWEYAAALNPEHSDESTWFIGLSLIMQKQYQAAEDFMQQLPAGAEKDQGMALIHFARGEVNESNAAIQRLSTGTDFDSAFYLTEIYSFQGDMDQSFRWLNEATDRILRTNPMVQSMSDLKVFKVCPFLAPLREDPRWTAWLVMTKERIGRNKT